MNSKRPLVPGFLNRLDNYLLINKPEIWSARTHLVVYFGVLFLAGLTFLSFIIPNDPRSDSPVFYWVGFVIIISIIALTGWLIYLLRFNVFKRYGNITPLSRLVTFLLYFIAAGTIFSFPLVMPYVESIRANKAYGDQEIVDDINAMNVKICQLEYDSLPHKLKQDTLHVVNQLPRYRSLPQDVEEDVVAMAPYRDYQYMLVDTASLRGRISGADSSVRVNDSIYVVFESKDYIFVRSYLSESYAPSELYSNYDLYSKIIRNHNPPDKRAIREELYRLLNKYRLYETTSNTYDYEADIYQKIRNKYELGEIDRSINNVTQRMYRWRDEYTSWIVRLYYYSTLFTTLLVFLYRHSTRKTFFLSLLAAIILTILTSLFAVYMNVNESFGFSWLIVYPVLFLVISLFSFKAKVRNVVTGIGINLFVLTVPFFPLCLVSYYYIVLKERNRARAYENLIDYDIMREHIWVAEIAGPLLLLLLLATYIQRVYRKWYALPEE